MEAVLILIGLALVASLAVCPAIYFIKMAWTRTRDDTEEFAKAFKRYAKISIAANLILILITIIFVLIFVAPGSRSISLMLTLGYCFVQAFLNRHYVQVLNQYARLIDQEDDHKV